MVNSASTWQICPNKLYQQITRKATLYLELVTAVEGELEIFLPVAKGELGTSLVKFTSGRSSSSLECV